MSIERDEFHGIGAESGADLFETLPHRVRCRYFLCVGDKTKETWGFRTKAAVEQWIQDRIAEYGLDWRVGYLVKLRGEQPLFRIVKRGGRLFM